MEILFFSYEAILPPQFPHPKNISSIQLSPKEHQPHDWEPKLDIEKK
jgi:hypothetical protein